MCSSKDIDAILEKLQNCGDHEEKKRILEQLVNCPTGQERLADWEASCRCDNRHVEFLYLLEQIKQHRPFLQSS